MSFMYKTMMSRAPNKRKIKINEENLLSLMTNSDDEDEEDEDFTISTAKNKKDDDEDGDEENSSTSSDSDDSKPNSTSEDVSSKQESEDDEQPGCSSQIRKPVRKKKKIAPRPTLKNYYSQVASEYYGLSNSTVEILKQAKKQWSQSEKLVNSMKSWPDTICSVCLDEEKSEKWNRLFTCQKCGVSVHVGCYQLRPGAMRKKCNEDIWICDSCIYGGDDVVCQFCPNLWGCMKETKCGRWVHIVCARSILSEFLHNSPGSSRKSISPNKTLYIQLSDQMMMNSKQYGQKECVLCEDRLVAKTGICIKCDAGLCKSSFHITCAQRHGLVSKTQSSGDANGTNASTPDSHIANCPLHCDKDEMRKRQRSFILQLKTAELERKRLEGVNQHMQSMVSSKLMSYRNARMHQRDSFIPPRPPLEQLPRLLSSDAHFTRLLNSKAEKMFGIETKAPALIIPKPTEIRKRHYVAPSLTTDFATYFLDRQLRIEEEKSSLETAIKTNCTLSKQQEYERMKYNEIRSKLLACKSSRSEMKKEFESLKQSIQHLSDWAASGNTLKNESKRRKSTTPVKRKPSRDLSVSPVSPVGSREHIPDAESIIDLKSCGICKRQDNQHLLVRCDVCRQWQHLGCLNPPLTQMPKRTKFSLWQCSECADSSGSSSPESERENRGSFTSQDGRRLTRRLRRAPEKLAIGFPDAPIIRRSKTLISHSKYLSKQQTRLRETLNTIARQQELQKRILASEQTPSLKPQQENKKSIEDDANKDKQSTETSENSAPDTKISTSSLQFGVSCDNYLSQAARIPIMSQAKPAAPSSTWAQNKMKKIIILKKTVPMPHRPIGLGQSKKQIILLKKPILSNPCEIQKSSDKPTAKLEKVLTKPAVSKPCQLKKSLDEPMATPEKVVRRPVVSKLCQIQKSLDKPMGKSEKVLTKPAVSKPCQIQKPLDKPVPKPEKVLKKPAMPKLCQIQTSSDKPMATPEKVLTKPAVSKPCQLQKSLDKPVTKSDKLLKKPALSKPCQIQKSVDKPVTTPEKLLKKPAVPKPCQLQKSLNKPVAKTGKVCTVCKSAGSEKPIVTCDTCHKNYHWECCDPPLKSNPVSKFATWECSDCVDQKDDVKEKKSDSEEENKRGSSVTPEGRRVISRKRKPPEHFEPAFRVSDQQKIFKSIEKQKLRRIESLSNTKEASSLTAARCRPVLQSGWKPKTHQKSPFPPPMPMSLFKSISSIDLSGFKKIAIVEKETGTKHKIINLIPCQK